MTLKLALFADSSPQFLERCLLSALAKRGCTAHFMTRAFVPPSACRSELNAFAPDAVLLWFAAETAEVRGFTDTEALEKLLPYPLIFYSMATLDDGCFGNRSLAEPSALRRKVLDWNCRLAALAEQSTSVTVVDLDLLQSRLGRAQTFDARLWETASMALTPAACRDLAEMTADALLAPRGQLRKAIVTDLDGTLWQGTVTEDGPEGIDPEAPGFGAYQRWLKRLSERGILLAIASRNDEAPVRKAFTHAGNILTWNDFSAAEISWGSKADALRRLAEKLHIGTNALVFLDDRPEQRAEVREQLPEVAVPELPNDPTLRPTFLAALGLFETGPITAADRLRVQSFRDDTLRAAARTEASSEAAYLASLQQELLPEPLGPSTWARAAQLTQRCNRFNMRGTRYEASTMKKKSGWVYRLKDRYGDLGIVSVVILNGPEIDTWVLSCRAFGRGLEQRILNHLKSLGPICGAYRATEKNALCKTIYADNGVPQP